MLQICCSLDSSFEAKLVKMIWVETSEISPIEMSILIMQQQIHNWTLEMDTGKLNTRSCVLGGI